MAKVAKSHHDIHVERRAASLDEARQNRQYLIRSEDVELHKTERGMRSGVLMGVEGDRPTRTIDANVHEIDPGVTSTIHRHSWDAVLLCVGGSGWTEIDGKRITWKAGDSLHLPSWSWHRHGNDAPGGAARFLSFSCEQFIESLNMAIIEDRGMQHELLPPRPSCSGDLPEGDSSYARRVRRVGGRQEAAVSGRLHTNWDDLDMKVNNRGARGGFLVDRHLGYETSGLSLVMFELGPGRTQSMHRHPGEAWLYILEGQGHTVMGPEPEGGTSYPWKKGDLVIVDHFLWHQHLNDSANETAKIVRVHIFDMLLETMQALMDPLVLMEEPPESVKRAQAGDAEAIEWSDMTRPSWP